MTNERIGLRLRELRTAWGRSQREIGEILGVPRSAVSLIESGDRALSAVELALLCRATGWSPYYLLGFDFLQEAFVLQGPTGDAIDTGDES